MTRLVSDLTKTLRSENLSLSNKKRFIKLQQLQASDTATYMRKYDVSHWMLDVVLMSDSAEKLQILTDAVFK